MCMKCDKKGKSGQKGAKMASPFRGSSTAGKSSFGKPKARVTFGRKK